jgi:hemoglobin-like flavoprotein
VFGCTCINRIGNMGATGSVIQEWNGRKHNQEKWQCNVRDLRSVEIVDESLFKELVNLCLLSWIRFDNVLRRLDGENLTSSSVPELMQKQFDSNVASCGSPAVKNLFAKNSNKLDSSAITSLTKFMFTLKVLDQDTMLHEMRKMGREYASLGCTREIMYEIFELMLSSISDCFGPLYNNDVENAWRLAAKFVLVFSTLEQVHFKDDHVTSTPSTARKHGDHSFRIGDIDCLSDEASHENT